MYLNTKHQSKIKLTKQLCVVENKCELKCKEDERCVRDEYTIDSYTHPEYSCKSNSFIPNTIENNMFSGKNTLNSLFFC